MLAGLLQNSSNLIDVGFTVFTTAICIKFLTHQTINNENVINHWRKELKGLELTIRALILEATTANNSLDRTLIKRKSDLERLLHRLEKIENKLDKPEKLPNESWSRKEDDIKLEKIIEEKNLETEQMELSYLVEDTKDSISLSSQRTSRVVKPKTTTSVMAAAMAKSKLATALKEQIEVSESANITQELIKTSILDPVTLKVAKRMLSQGKEIQVVAKKLDLSLQQIRTLDKMLRKQGLEFEAGPNFKKQEVVSSTNIIRNKDENKRFFLETSNKDLFDSRPFEIGEEK